MKENVDIIEVGIKSIILFSFQKFMNLQNLFEQNRDAFYLVGKPISASA